MYRTYSIIEGDFLKMNDMFEIPTHNHPAAGYRRQRHMQRIS